MTVFGDVVMGDQFNSHHGAAGAAILPVRDSVAEPAGWSPGTDVTVRDHVYLLQEHYLAEYPSLDGSVLCREARALRLRERPRRPERRSPRSGHRSEYAWLRQVVVREDNVSARNAVGALREERRLLESLGGVPGLPRVLKADAETTTLALTWPASKSTGGPCPALDTRMTPDGGGIGPARMYGLFTGLADLCGTLAKLHEHGVAHRRLTPSVIVMLDGPGLVLRDLGLAARAPEAAEGPPEYQAPEQRWRHETPPGPHTDVYLLAAVVHHLLTGRPPASRAPAPVGGQVSDLPESIGHVLDAALASAPAERPTTRALGNAFRAARNDLS